MDEWGDARLSLHVTVFAFDLDFYLAGVHFYEATKWFDSNERKWIDFHFLSPQNNRPFEMFSSCRLVLHNSKRVSIILELLLLLLLRAISWLNSNKPTTDKLAGALCNYCITLNVSCTLSIVDQGLSLVSDPIRPPEVALMEPHRFAINFVNQMIWFRRWRLQANSFHWLRLSWQPSKAKVGKTIEFLARAP